MDSHALQGNGDTSNLYRSFNLISQVFEGWHKGLYQPVFTQLPIAILVLRGDDYIIESTNDVNLAIWGKEADVIGKPLLEVMPDFNDPEHLKIFKGVYTTGVSFYSKALPIALTKNNKLNTGYYNVEYQALRDMHGLVNGILVTGYDVTHYIHTQKQLEQSEQKLRDIIHYAPAGIAIYHGRNVVFEYANEEYLQKVDKSYSELIGKPFFEVLPEFKNQGLEEIIEEVFNTGKPYYAKTFSATFTRYGKKEPYYSNLVYYPLRNIDNEVDGFMVIFNDISDLVKSTKFFEDSERKFRNLVMQSPVAMGIFQGADFVIELANDTLLKTWRRSNAEVCGRKLTEVFPELQNQPMLAWMKEVYETGKTINQNEVFVYINTTKDERVSFYVQLRINPLQDTENKVSGIIVSINDITAQVHARKQVEENEQYFRKMADNVPVIIFLWKSDGYCTYKNKKWFEYTGAGQEDAQGFNWLNYVDINSRPEVQQTLFSAIKNKSSLRVELQIKRKDGKYCWFEKAVTPRFNSEGQIEGFIGTMTDIHERKLAEEQLRDAEERLRLAAEATSMATFDMDMQTFTTIYSPRLLEILGLENAGDSALPRVDLLKSMHPDDLIIIENALQEAYETGAYMYEARVIWPDQSIRWIKAQGKIFYSFSNRPMRMIGMVEDITKRKQLERYKDDFMGIVSHELKTPVTSLKVYTQLLYQQFDCAGNEIPANMLQRMDNQINKLSLLIKDLLDTASIDTGTLQVASQLFDLNNVLTEVLEEVSFTYTTHHITRKSNKSYFVMGDAVRTFQVIFNFISNAVKYSPHASEIVIDLQQKDTFVICCVQDFGMGIAHDNLSNIFEKYFRINNKILGTYPGLGLGLFISAQIIRLQGGEIWVQSEEGKGSTFCFKLPIAVSTND